MRLPRGDGGGACEDPLCISLLGVWALEAARAGSGGGARHEEADQYRPSRWCSINLTPEVVPRYDVASRLRRSINKDYELSGMWIVHRAAVLPAKRGDLHSLWHMARNWAPLVFLRWLKRIV